MLLNNDTLNQISTQLDERGEALTRKIGKLEEQLSKKKNELNDAEHERLRASSSAEEKSAVKSIMGKDHSRQLSQLRRDLVAASQSDRNAVLDVLPKYEEHVAQTAALYKNPQQLLARQGLGDERRTQLERQLRGMGPASLRGMKDLALAEGDKVLAAAIWSVEDRRSKGKRSVDLTQLASHFFGDEVALMQTRLKELQLKIDAMRHVNTTFERGVENSHDRIKLGLSRRALERKVANRADVAARRAAQ